MIFTFNYKIELVYVKKLPRKLLRYTFVIIVESLFHHKHNRYSLLDIGAGTIVS